MKSPIIYFSLMLCSVGLFAQSYTSDTTKLTKWLGNYSGTLTMYSTNKAPQEIPMQVRLFETDTSGTYGWQLIYGEDEAKGMRAYFLKVQDLSSNHYLIDEKNGILLDAYLIENKMISDFEVDGSTITSIYTLEDENNLTFEIIAGSSLEPSISGGDNEIPKVLSFPIKGYHRANLKRVLP